MNDVSVFQSHTGQHQRRDQPGPGRSGHGLVICIGDVMATQQRQEPFVQVPAGVFAPMQRLTSALVTGPTYEPAAQEREEDGQDLVSHLQQWICELLIKNQQLRMSLQSATALEQEDQDSRNL